MGRVRAVFSLDQELVTLVFGEPEAVRYLAYIEWYTRLTLPNSTHGMFVVKPSISTQGTWEAAVIELGQIRQSVHLVPKFPREVAKDPIALKWTSNTVLDTCPEFVVNRHLNRQSFQMLYP